MYETDEKKEELKKTFYSAIMSISKLEDYTKRFYPNPLSKFESIKKENFNNAFTKTIKNLEILLRYYTKKKHSVKHIAEHIFLVDNKKTSKDEMFTYNLEAIISSMERTKNQLHIANDSKECFYSNAGKFLALNDIVMDTHSFLVDKIKNYGFYFSCLPNVSRTRKIDSIEAYYTSLGLSRREANLDDNVIPALSMFLLRQAIELRILEIFGISRIVDLKGNIVKITADKFIPLFKESVFILPVSGSVLQKIYTWTNQYVHLGKSSMAWQIEYAQYYLFPFFANDLKVYMIKSYKDDFINNFDNIIKIKDKDSYRIEGRRKNLICLLDKKSFDEKKTKINIDR